MPVRPTQKFVALLSVAIALAASAVGVWWWQSRIVAPVQTVTVERFDLESNITATGTLQPRRYVDVGAQVSGTILRLHAQPGDRVKEGQLLVEIDASVQQAVVDAGRAALADLSGQLAEQQTQLKLAQRQLARQRQLDADQATRAEDVQSAEASHDGASARVAQLQARIEQTRATQRAEETRLGYARIYAPMAGTVISVEPREGQTLNATYQTPHILRIADLSAMTVWAEVSEADVHGVRAGMPAWFTTLGQPSGAVAGLSLPAGTPRRWRGQVRQVLPAPPSAERRAGEAGNAPADATGRVVVYTALFDVDNADGVLLPRMTAQVAFVAAAAPDVLAVPLEALEPVHGEPGVFQARVRGEDGRIDLRRVRIGVSDGVRAQVLEGLADGDHVLAGAAS